MKSIGVLAMLFMVFFGLPTSAQASWEYCAGENGTCNAFNGVKHVRYGSAETNRFEYKWIGAPFTCSNAVFGDPAPGQIKSCWFDNPADTGVLQPAWVECAREGDTCVFSGMMHVRYGVPGRFASKWRAGFFSCGIAAFDDIDPAPGELKSCWYDHATGTGTLPTPARIAGKTVVYGPVEITKIERDPAQVLENKHIISTTGHCIRISNEAKNVTIKNNEIGPCGTASISPDDFGIVIEGPSSDIKIHDNVIHGVSTAVRANLAQHPIMVYRNYVYNIRGPFLYDADERVTRIEGSLTQFSFVRSFGRAASSKISCNILDGTYSNPSDGTVPNAKVGDAINLFKTVASAEYPTEIAYNRIRGYTDSRVEKSGAAINVTDSAEGGTLPNTNDNGYVMVRHNTIVQHHNVGVAVPGGSHVGIEDNRVDHRTDDDKRLTGQPFLVASYPGRPVSYVWFKRNRGVGKEWAWGKGEVVGYIELQRPDGVVRPKDIWVTINPEDGNAFGEDARALSLSSDMWMEHVPECDQ